MCVHADSLLRSTGIFSDSQANEGNVFWNWPVQLLANLLYSSSILNYFTILQPARGTGDYVSMTGAGFVWLFYCKINMHF